MKWLKVIDDGLFCPTCLCGKKIFFKRVKPPLGFKSYSSDIYYLYKCGDCSWNGDPMDLITEEEFKNIKRTKLIDKMLC